MRAILSGTFRFPRHHAFCISSILYGFICFGRFASGADSPPADDPFLDNLPKVEAATLHSQTLDEAPANVTVISREQIRTYGYRTLAEALQSVRGFYISREHIYSYAGVRGFSLPGDFNTRFLVMINGHVMTEPVFSQNNFFERDFAVDMELVERIEVIRGPSSSLYGSNGIFATINVVTVAPVDFDSSHVTVEAGSFGEKRALAAGAFYLGKGANMVWSMSGHKSQGRNYYFPQLDTPENNNGQAISMDGEGSYRFFSNLTWRSWSFLGVVSNRDKRVPLAWDSSANTLFSRGNHANDLRTFGMATYRRTIGRGDLRWQISYDNYDYSDRFDMLAAPTEPGSGAPTLTTRNTLANSEWVSTRLTFQWDVAYLGSLTAGFDSRMDLRNLQVDEVAFPQREELIRLSKPERTGAMFLEQEKRLSPHWKLDLAVRLDASRLYGEAASPKVALAYQPSSRTVYKFVYGRPFRNPSNYEQFYYDNIAILPNWSLQRERADTFEVSVEHHLTPNVTGTVNAYKYSLHDLIQSVYLEEGVSRFMNVGSTRAEGVEFELGGKWNGWLETVGSYTWQHTAQQASSTPVPNSPAHIGKVRWAIPAGRRVALAGSLVAMSSRYSADNDRLRSVLIGDITLNIARIFDNPWTSNLGLQHIDLQVGVRNTLNWAYMDPTGLSLAEIPGDSRSLYVKFTRRTGR